MINKLKVLFLCTGNSCRSQMAEAWAKELKSGLFEAYSAGIETHGLNKNAVKVMAEVGVDMSGHISENVRDYLDKDIDLVVTVCDHASETCPIFPGSIKLIHHSFEDPPKLARNKNTDDEKLECYRKVRDEIKDFIMQMKVDCRGLGV